LGGDGFDRLTDAVTPPVVAARLSEGGERADDEEPGIVVRPGRISPAPELGMRRGCCDLKWCSSEIGKRVD
jgi:hypothetical protein